MEKMEMLLCYRQPFSVFMMSLIENLRKKPEQQRRTIAFWSAFFITFIIFLVWLVSMGGKIFVSAPTVIDTSSPNKVENEQ